MALGPQSLTRPTSVSIFKQDPVGLGQAMAFLLSNVSIPSPNVVRFDGTESETETITFTPAEERTLEAFATTGLRKDPEVFTVSGILTATPPGIIGIGLSFGSRWVRRDITAYQRLLAIAELREPVIVVLRERSLPSMSIVAVSRTKTPTHGDALRVGVTFRESRIVSPATVLAVVDLAAHLAGAASSTDLGAQGTTAASVPADVAAGGLG